MTNDHYQPAHAKPKESFDCAECHKPMADHGYWEHTGRVFQMRCINKDCGQYVGKKMPDRFPTSVELGWI